MFVSKFQLDRRALLRPFRSWPGRTQLCQHRTPICLVLFWRLVPVVRTLVGPSFVRPNAARPLAPPFGRQGCVSDHRGRHSLPAASPVVPKPYVVNAARSSTMFGQAGSGPQNTASTPALGRARPCDGLWPHVSAPPHREGPRKSRPPGVSNHWAQRWAGSRAVGFQPGAVCVGGGRKLLKLLKSKSSDMYVASVSSGTSPARGRPKSAAVCVRMSV